PGLDAKGHQQQLPEGDRRRGVSLMRAIRLSALATGLAIALSAGAAPAQTAAPTRDDIVTKLNHLDETVEVDLPALKQQVMERAKARIKNDPGPV
ncbi:hypothetical protein WAC35_28755, partial [Klebsiella pneumoniae]